MWRRWEKTCARYRPKDEEDEGDDADQTKTNYKDDFKMTRVRDRTEYDDKTKAEQDTYSW